jgi:hypothetical protein
VNVNTKISPDEVRTFVDVVNVLVQEIKEIDQQFLQKGTNAVFTGLKTKAGSKVVANNSTTLLYMYNSSSLNNNFKKLVKPGSGAFVYKQNAQLPKISDMNDILATVRFESLTDANINSLIQTAKNRTPSVAARLTKLSGGITNLIQKGKDKFQNAQSLYSLQGAQKKLEGAKNRINAVEAVNEVVPAVTGNGAGAAGAVTGNGAPAVTGNGAPAVTGNGAPAEEAAALEVANAMSEANASNIRRLVKNNSLSNNAIKGIVSTNNQFLKKFKNANTNNKKIQVLRQFNAFANSLNAAAKAKGVASGSNNQQASQNTKPGQ